MPLFQRSQRFNVTQAHSKSSRVLRGAGYEPEARAGLNCSAYIFQRIDKLVKSPKFRHAPAFPGAGSAKAGIQNYLKTLDSRLRGNDAKGRFKIYYETINVLDA
jgi:hypothetical protein